MSALFLCAALLAASQAPAQHRARAPAPPATRDTIYVAVQTPPPTVVVEAPSQWPAVVLGVFGLVLLGVQLWIMWRQSGIMGQQTKAMEAQSALLAKQTALGEQQAKWQRAEAVGAFHRLISDLAAELSLAVNIRASRTVPVESNPHPRQVLRDAPRTFAPLGSSVFILLNQIGFGLDRYYDALAAYNRGLLIPDVDVNLRAAEQWRKNIGVNVDKVSAELRQQNLGKGPSDASPDAAESRETFDDVVVYLAGQRAWEITTPNRSPRK